MSSNRQDSSSRSPPGASAPTHGQSSSGASMRAVESGFASLRASSPNRSSIPPTNSLVRKADMACNHVTFVERSGPCRVSRKKIDVVANYFKLHAPSRLQAHCYRIELKQQRRNAGFEEVIKREKAEPLFWSLYQQHRNLFPRALNRLVFDGVGTIYTLEPLQFRGGSTTVDFPVTPPSANQRAGNQRGGRQGSMARATILVLPIFVIDDFFTVDESVRTQMVQLLDLIISQEMRCPLVANASRFVQQGHSLFKVPVTPQERRMCVRPIGMGEEVWTGLHMAVKADCPEDLFINANTSTSLFYTAKLNLVDFYSQVMHGYTMDHREIDGDNIMIHVPQVKKLGLLLQGTKVRYQTARGDWKVKKFEGITEHGAAALEFHCEGRGMMTVAEYFVQARNIRLRFPNLPCLVFKSRDGSPGYFPIEICETSEDIRKYKGKLTDQQLNTFIKAAGMGPVQKRRLIETLTSDNGSYLGQGTLMQEWGVTVDREMVEIKEATVLPFPQIQWRDKVSLVNDISGEYNLTENDQTTRSMIETGPRAIAVVYVYVDANGTKMEMDPSGTMSDEEWDRKQQQLYQSRYKENSDFFADTMRAFGMDVLGPAWNFRHFSNDKGAINYDGIDNTIKQYKKMIEDQGRAQNKEFMPLFVFIFPRRIEKLYSCLKYKCDIEHGVLSQVILSRTFQKFTGNPRTNSSSQNILLKVLAKAGGVACKIDGNQFRSIGKMTTLTEPTLVLGIDVSHPSREERQAILAKKGYTQQNTRAANQRRGQHEQLPTARPYGKSLFEEINYYDCPRSVAAVVGNIDIAQTKWGVSSRVQRLGQEETLNLTEPFCERIKDFFDKTGVFPKHIIVYRDGVSDSQFKKALYDESESLKRAIEKLSLNAEKTQATITYIVGKKRHHTRLFPSDPTQAIDLAGQPGANTPPGLLIETKITSKNTFDFYIQSHYGNLGTAVPTHYTVLMDEWKPSPSFWQTVIFGHCFCNARCTKPLSIPIPLHYAHLAAKRAKRNFDHFRDHAPEEYLRSKEDLVRESMELIAITANSNLTDIDSLFFA